MPASKQSPGSRFLFQFRISEEERAAFRQRAAECKTTPSEWARTVLRRDAGLWIGAVEPTYRVIVGERGTEQGHVVPVDGDEKAARRALRRELRAYKGDGWGRVEVSRDGGENWERIDDRRV